MRVRPSLPEELRDASAPEHDREPVRCHRAARREVAPLNREVLQLIYEAVLVVHGAIDRRSFGERPLELLRVVGADRREESQIWELHARLPACPLDRLIA